ncbi:MAG: hypothetical protein IJ124_05100 [Clostridia bacterium]|nr:hypothetical protein [Clostridia bacterium]MBQ8708118.1 hypothetical protein [Succinivibrionaceae bacterium]MBQ8708164.1 hypothetical protein [Succinivibrionaceae bacterium]
MKRKLLGVVFFVVAIAVMLASANAGGANNAGAGVIGIVLIVLGLRQFDVLNSKNASVWVVPNGDTYHRKRRCPHIKGKGVVKMPKPEALGKGCKPCRTCYPYAGRG